MASPATPQSSLRHDVKDFYLIVYNTVSGLAWASVLYVTISALILGSHDDVYREIGVWTRWTQTAAGLEIAHSVTGIVRAPFLTTLMQVSSRFALVWGAVYFYPEIATSPSYSSMLLAWSVTEVVRYFYFTIVISQGTVPYALKWMRYSGFFVLYPVGISSELFQLSLALSEAWFRSQLLTAVIIGVVMASYVPGAPKLFRHMMRQRRKVLAEGTRR